MMPQDHRSRRDLPHIASEVENRQIPTVGVDQAHLADERHLLTGVAPTERGRSTPELRSRSAEIPGARARGMFQDESVFTGRFPNGHIARVPRVGAL
jgi:hypothetical protein